MKKIKVKNYIILAILIVCTVIVTLVLANIYRNKDKEVSPFYEYANKITTKEFDQYTLESSDIIIYISDKYNLNHIDFEKKFEDKITELNLKEKLIYIDKKDINKKFLSKLKNQYNVTLDLNKLPAALIIVDKELQKEVYIDKTTDVDNFIEYGAFQ